MNEAVSFDFLHRKMLLQHFFVEYLNANNSMFKNIRLNEK